MEDKRLLTLGLAWKQQGVEVSEDNRTGSQRCTGSSVRSQERGSVGQKARKPADREGQWGKRRAAWSGQVMESGTPYQEVGVGRGPLAKAE